MLMKDIFLGGMLALCLSGCGQMQARKAAGINDVVVSEHKKLMSSLEDFTEALEMRNESEIRKTLAAMKDRAAGGAELTGAQEPVKCSTAFLPAAAEMFQFYLDAADGEYAAIASYYSSDSISYAEYDSLQLMIQRIETAQQEAGRIFLEAQQSFARSCGFKLVRHVE